MYKLLSPAFRIASNQDVKRLAALTLLVFLWAQGGARNLAAQDLVITNAHIIVGNGNVIDRGSIVVRNGRLASVSAGAANASGMQAIDAHGMTAMPGFIDAHRHIMQGNSDQWLKDQAAARIASARPKARSSRKGAIGAPERMRSR